MTPEQVRAEYERKHFDHYHAPGYHDRAICAREMLRR